MAHVSKITNGNPIKSFDKGALLDFALQMKSCENTLEAIGYIDEINSTDNLRRIAERLPFNLRTKWLSRSRSLRLSSVRPGIRHLSQFVQEQADEANDPVFGDILSHPRAKVKEPQKRKATSAQVPLRSATTLVTQGIQRGNKERSESQQPPVRKKGDCPACEGFHILQNCKKFKDMSNEDRVTILRKDHICFNCFTKGHYAVGFAQPSACTVENCKSKHQTIMHRTSSNPSDEVKESKVTPEAKNEERKEQLKGQFHLIGVGNQCTSDNNKVFLKVVPVRVRNHHGEFIETYALLDSGADVCLCDEQLLTDLKLDSQEKRFLLTTQEKKDSCRIGKETSITVESMDGKKAIAIPRVWAIEPLNVSENSIPTKEDLQNWPHLQDIDMPAPHIRKVTLLIGCNVPEAFFVLEERRGEPDEPYGVRTTLGWTVIGPSKYASSRTSSQTYFVRTAEVPVITTSIEAEDRNLNSQLERLWNIDFGDSLLSHKPCMSIEDSKALDIMEKSAKIVGGHYQLALPWKCDSPFMPNNRGLAEYRLNLLKKRFQKDEEVFQKYCTSMNENFNKGFAIKVPDEDLSVTDRPVWFLPHHGVFHPQKPEKLRVVFDCAAKFRGISLNDQLYQGPDLTNSLIGVLSRFRQDPIAVVADIEAMFHQVLVDPKDQDALRFLWWPNNDLSQEPREYRMRVHLFGATSSPSCASFSLRKTAEDHRNEFNQSAVNSVLRNFYVDDFLKSMKTTEEAKKIVSDVTTLLTKGGFRLAKWVSNRKEVVQDIHESERARSISSLNLDLDDLPTERTLGVLWDVNRDVFSFKVALKEKPKTRRGILSSTSSIYDPLGFIAPVILPAKKLVQDLSRKKLDWDEEIEEGDAAKWDIWTKDLPSLSNVAVKRSIVPENFGSVYLVQLHHFADASEISYGAVSYIRLINFKNDIHCSFVMGKCRLAPIKTISIPRLEVSAAVLTVKFDKTIKEELELPIHESIFWTDSTTILGYIMNTASRFHTFVANRLSVIHSGSSPKQWRYVPSELNPADSVTRGLSVADFCKDENRWLYGPKFLLENEDCWPAQQFQPAEESTLEVKRERKVFLAVSPGDEIGLDKLINYHSCWYKLKKSVAWILRFIRYTSSRSQRSKEFKTESLLPSEVKSAESTLIRHAQRQSFIEEIKSLQSRDTSNQSRKSSRKCLGALFKLNPILDSNGMLRVGGRLRKAPVEYDLKHPFILHGSHRVTRLIVEECHKNIGHTGQNFVLSVLREHYWIVKGRHIVRKVIGDCMECKKRDVRSGEQLMADLPVDRLTPDKPPFTFVGVDYFGPLYVRQGRSQVERYGCVFTCLVVRAIHIEIAHSLDTTSFLNALRRFTSRRGTPELIRSDNGTNFVGGERELREAIENWNQHHINDNLRQRRITWKFNPPHSSHMGGVWERQIRTIRRILKVLLKDQLVSDEALLTFMTEVEFIVNSRPITPVSNDPNDLEPLTPNQILLLRRFPVSLPPGIFDKNDLYPQRRWRQMQYLSEMFWKRWSKEYLPMLQERKKWNQPRRNFAIGDLVLVGDASLPRNQWQLGRIIQVFPDKKGLVRMAEIKTKSATVTRPISKLCLLEGV